MWPPPPESVALVLVCVVFLAIGLLLRHRSDLRRLARTAACDGCAFTPGRTPSRYVALSAPPIPPMPPALVTAAGDAVTTSRATASELEATGAVLWTIDEEGNITRTTGGGLVRYGVTPSEVVGTSMREWPQPALWAWAIQRLRDHPDVPNVNIVGEKWLRYSLVTIARRPRGGGFVAIAIPMPSAEELAHAPSDC